jgi:putative inorganic carbon (HCO3(-)) transporter
LTIFHRFRSTIPEPEKADPVGWLGVGLLVALVVTAPIAWGGVLPGGSLIIQILAFSAASVAFLSRATVRPRLPALPLAAVSGILLLGLVQLAPLPENLLGVVSPVSRQVFRETKRILDLFGAAASSPAISIVPRETISTVLLLLAYIAAFLAASRVLSTRTRRRVFLAGIFGAALVQIVIAALSAAPTARKGGSFVNPDHLAGYLEISLALAFGVAWATFSVGRDRVGHLADRGERLERRLVPLSLSVLLWGTIAAGIGLTQSRGGVGAALVTVLFLIVLFSMRRRLGSRRAAASRATLILMAGLLFVAFAIREIPVVRFLATDPRDLPTEGRLQIWAGSIQAFRQFPVVGSGLGTFREAFRRIQPRDFIEGLVEQAHSDSLQLLVTGGAVGAALGVLALVSGLFALFRAAQRQRHREETALLIGGLGALVSLTLHGLVDFNFSLPAIPVTLAAVLGGAWAAGEASASGPATTTASTTATFAPARVRREKVRRPLNPERGMRSRSGPEM